MVRKGTTRVIKRKATLVGGTEEERMQSASRGVATESARGRVNKDELIGLEISQHPRWSTARIVTKLEEEGLATSAANVDSIREKFQAIGRGSRAKPTARSRSKPKFGEREVRPGR